MLPKILGLETEYGISTNEFNDLSWSSIRAADEVVSAITQLDMCFVDRGLEEIGTIEEHERAEEEAAAQLVSERENSPPLHQDDVCNGWLTQSLSVPDSGAMRQRRGMSGYVLQTGARYYVDMGHPEYSTPETLSPYTVVLVQKAGDLIVEECRKVAELSMRERTGNHHITLHVHRNNSDGLGSSYAGHENYSLMPSTFDRIIHYQRGMFWCSNHHRMEMSYVPVKGMYTDFVLTFFVTRQIIIGAGKVGSETLEYTPYQISSRADFMVQDVGGSTVTHRPIINTRDQPLAGHTYLRRLHVICGDSNMSELSIYLKVGMTALFFQMLEAGLIQSARGDFTLPLANAVAAYQTVSRDLTLRKQLPLVNGNSMTALEAQWMYCQMAKTFVARSHCDPVWADVVQKWEGVLEGLEGNRTKHKLSRNLDWVMKEQLLALKQKRDSIGPTDDACRNLALTYHDINPEYSMYHRVVEEGRMMRIVSADEITQMTRRAPSDTRAWLRGELLRRYTEEIYDIGWDYAYFKNGRIIHMSDPRHGTEAEMRPFLHDNPPCEEFLHRIKKASEDGVIPGLLMYR